MENMIMLSMAKDAAELYQETPINHTKVMKQMQETTYKAL